MKNKLPEFADAITLTNLEQREAYQEQVDAHRNEFVDSLPEKEQLKFQACEDAMKILEKANVPAYIFAMLPDPESYHNTDDLGFYTEYLRKYSIVQYNDLSSCDPPDEGKHTAFLSYFNTMMAGVYSSMISACIPSPHNKNANMIMSTLYNFAGMHHKWKKDGIYPPSVQKYIDEEGPIFL